ncbi:MAG: hypothetical protein M3335_09065 [Actinomycetota bacterium]|nr:hypothetical protein [Actinomycetota bacterium]
MTESQAQATLGNVYVFNYYSEEIENLNVAGEKVTQKPIEGWSKGTEKEGLKYTPRGITVPRAKPAEEVPGKFGLGDQLVRAEWPSKTKTVTVHIPNTEESGVNLTEDLILLISPSSAILLGPNGRLLGPPKNLQDA